MFETEDFHPVGNSMAAHYVCFDKEDVLPILGPVNVSVNLKLSTDRNTSSLKVITTYYFGRTVLR